MKLSKKKAFTLVELLVVVLVLGVLAGVGVPKFKRMLETRKTGEAEAMLAAVRMEQEKRCIAGKEYRTDLNKLDVLSTASGSKNYTYKLTSTGIVAEAKGKSKEADQYNLQLTSYKEGNICCSGEGCKKLNKNYPECKALVRDECSADVQCTGEEPASGKKETSGRCELTYSQDVECDKDYGNWKESGFVLAKTECTCEDPVLKEETEKCSRTRSDLGCNTSTGVRSYGEWSAWVGGDSGTDVENTTDGKCEQNWKKTCQSDGSLVKELVGAKTCSCTTGASSGTDSSGSCTISWTQECVAGVWTNYKETKSKCKCTGKTKPSESDTKYIDHGSCPLTRTVTCNPNTDEWNEPGWTEGTCTCDSGYTWNSSTKKCDPEPTEIDCKESDKPKDSQGYSITNGYCKQTRTVTCNKSSGTWSTGNWSDECDCYPPWTYDASTKKCICNKQDTASATINLATCSYSCKTKICKKGTTLTLNYVSNTCSCVASSTSGKWQRTSGAGFEPCKCDSGCKPQSAYPDEDEYEGKSCSVGASAVIAIYKGKCGCFYRGGSCVADGPNGDNNVLYHYECVGTPSRE